jgi:hypothetical protein
MITDGISTVQQISIEVINTICHPRLLLLLLLTRHLLLES